MRFLLLIAFIFGVLSALYRPAFSETPTAVGTEFRVNATTSGFQSNPAIASLTDGTYVVTWQSAPPNFSNSYIYARRLSSIGAPVSSEFRVDSVSGSFKLAPAIAALTNGGFVITWQSFGQDGSEFGIFAQRYNSNGAPVGSEFQVNTSTASIQTAPAIAGLNDGGFIITWNTNQVSGTDTNIRAQRYDSSGTPTGAEFLVNTHLPEHQQRSSVASFSSGGFVVTWSSFKQSGFDFQIFGQRFASSGNKIGPEFLVNTIQTSSGVSSVQALTGGGYVITWLATKPVPSGSINVVYARVYAADGTPLTLQFEVDPNGRIANGRAPTTKTKDGGFLATAGIQNQIGPISVGIGQRYATDASPIGAIADLTGDTRANILGQVIAGLANGRFALAWQETSSENSSADIMGRIFEIPSSSNLVVTPDDYGLTAIGNVGGAFLPANKTYTLTNGGSTAINWIASEDIEGMNVTPSSGNLAPGASVTVAVQVDAGTDSMTAGELRTGTLTITDTNENYGSVYRPLTLRANSDATGTANLFASILPSARAGLVNSSLTAFATIVNPSQTHTAVNCTISPPLGTPATFAYWRTSASNVTVGGPNLPVDVPAGGTQSFVFALTPTIAANANLGMVFECTNTDQVGTIWGLNTFSYSSSNTPIPDVVAISSTVGNNGYANLPNNTGAAVFAVSIINIGGADTVTARVTDQANGGPDPNISANFTLCPTNPTTGACEAPPSGLHTFSAASNGVYTFSVFLTGTGFIPNDPANNRVHVYFDFGGSTVGATSVAVCTGC